MSIPADRIRQIRAILLKSRRKIAKTPLGMEQSVTKAGRGFLSAEADSRPTLLRVLKAARKAESVGATRLPFTYRWRDPAMALSDRDGMHRFQYVWPRRRDNITSPYTRASNYRHSIVLDKRNERSAKRRAHIAFKKYQRGE